MIEKILENIVAFLFITITLAPVVIYGGMLKVWNYFALEIYEYNHQENLEQSQGEASKSK